MSEEGELEGKGSLDIEALPLWTLDICVQAAPSSVQVLALTCTEDHQTLQLSLDNACDSQPKE
jgi:hypothetical protein